MKLVREHINEIKRYDIKKGGSGWGSLDIGNINVCPAYEKIKEKFPEEITEFSIAILEEVNDILSDAITKSMEYFECSIKSILWANQSWLSSNCKIELNRIILNTTDTITIEKPNIHFQCSPSQGISIVNLLSSDRQMFILKSPTL